MADVNHEGMRLIPGAVDSDLGMFRQQVREDPGGALDLVRGEPLEGVDASWAVPLRGADLGVAGRAKSLRALEMAYGWASDTFATAGPGTVPTDITREYTRWQHILRSR